MNHVRTPQFQSTSRRGVVIGAAILATAAFVAVGPAMTVSADSGTNSVAYWCGGEDLGIKYEPVSTPFLVPAPPVDSDWTKAIVKAGSDESVANENTVYEPVSEGDSLTHAEDKAISHVILCWEDTPPETTTPPADTTPPEDTTPPQETTPPAETAPPITQQSAPPMVTDPPQQAQLPPAPAPAPTVLSSGGATVTEQLPATGAERELLFAAIGGGLVMAGFTLRRLSRRPA